MKSAGPMVFTTLSHRLALMLGLLLAASGITKAGDIVIEQAISPLVPLFVEPGGSTQFVLRVRNAGTTAVPLATFRAAAPILPRPPIWTFAPTASAGCSAMRLVEVYLNWPGWEFDVLDLAPGEQVECTYVLNRGEAATTDIRLIFSLVTPAADPWRVGKSVSMVAGSLTHVELSIREACELPATTNSRTVRVSVTNHGPTSRDGVGFGFCLDNFFPGFIVDGQIPDGCGVNRGAPGLCLMGGIGWSVPALPSGETAICLLELRAHASPAGQDPFPIRLAQSYRSGSLNILDTAPVDFPGYLSLASPTTCSRAAAAPVLVPLGGAGWTWIMLIAVLTLTASAKRAGGGRES